MLTVIGLDILCTPVSVSPQRALITALLVLPYRTLFSARSGHQVLYPTGHPIARHLQSRVLSRGVLSICSQIYQSPPVLLFRKAILTTEIINTLRYVPLRYPHGSGF